MDVRIRPWARVLAWMLLMSSLCGTHASGGSGAGLENGPSAQLKKEHDITLKMLGAAETEAVKIRSSGTVDKQRVAKMQDFFSNFVDACHHAKEERFYFAAAKFFDGEEIDRQVSTLVDEHDYARTLLQEVAYELEGQEVRPALIADRLARYAEIIRAHIGKEDELFYPRADIVLPEMEQAGLMVGFARIEKQELGEGFHEKYHTLAMEVLGEQE